VHPPTHTLVPKPASLEELIQKAKVFVAAAKAPATLKAYRNDWLDFESWCRTHELPSLPSAPESVALYIADRASTLASGTIARRLTSITKANQAAASPPLLPRPVTSSWARRSRVSAAPSAPRSTERIRSFQLTSAGLSPPGVRTFLASGMRRDDRLLCRT